MSKILRLFLLFGALCSMGFMLRKIRKNKIKIDDSIFWIIFSAILVLLALFPSITEFAAVKMGVMSPVNLLYLIMHFIVIVLLFHHTVQISKLEEKIKELTQQLALEKKRNEDGRD